MPVSQLGLMKRGGVALMVAYMLRPVPAVQAPFLFGISTCLPRCDVLISFLLCCQINRDHCETRTTPLSSIIVWLP